MSNRRFIVLFLLGIALLASALVVLTWRSRVVANEATRSTLCTFAPERVDALALSWGEKNAVRLVRDAAGAWSLVEPYAAPADAAAVARLVDALTLLPFCEVRTDSELAELHEDLADFGLAGDPRAAVTVTSDARETRVVLGAKTASGREVYARVEGLLNVFTVPVAVLEAVPDDADGFRRRVVVATPREEIVGLDLRAPDSPFVKLVRGESGWCLSVPQPVPAEEAAVASLVEALVTARVGGFVLPSARHHPPSGESPVLPPSALVPYGLAADAGLAVTVRTAGGTLEQVVFGASAGTNLVYALVQNGTAVVAIDAAVADACRASGASLRDTRVFPLGADARLLSLSVTSGALVYVLAADTNGVWRLSAPVAAPADQTAAGALVERILHLRRSDIPEKLEPEACVRVAVETTAGPQPAVEVPRALLAACGALADLRSKTLFALDPASVSRITVKPAEGRPVAVVRDAERGTWALDAAAGAVPATVKPEAVKALLAALTRVEAVGVETVAATPVDSRRCGLETPAFTLAVDFTDAASVRRNILLGGAAPGGGRYATVGGADAVFILSRTTVAALTIMITE